MNILVVFGRCGAAAMCPSVQPPGCVARVCADRCPRWLETVPVVITGHPYLRGKIRLVTK